MSITFEPVPHPADVQEYRALCWNLDVDSEVPIFSVTDYSKIGPKFNDHRMTCAECDAYGRPVLEYVTDVPSMNVSNSNGAVFITMLGFEVDFSGSCVASVFLSRVNAAQMALEGSREESSTNVMLINDAYVLDYIDSGLTKLRHIAEWAVHHGRDVQWA